jgi:hypothetical protein
MIKTGEARAEAEARDRRVRRGDWVLRAVRAVGRSTEPNLRSALGRGSALTKSSSPVSLMSTEADGLVTEEGLGRVRVSEEGGREGNDMAGLLMNCSIR